MIWTAYLDESGTHDDSPIMLMGGYLGNTEQWAAFDNAWKSLLESEGIPYSHAKDLAQGRKQFKGWRRKRRVQFVEKASQLKALHLQLGVTAVLREND